MVFDLNVASHAIVDIKGISLPDAPFDYNASHFGKGLLGEDRAPEHDWQVGPHVMHIYDVTNQVSMAEL